MRSSKTGRKTSSVASSVWHVAQSCWNQMLPISSPSIFVNNNLFNMERQRSPLTVMAFPCSFWKKIAELCLWTKIRTKQWLVLGASSFQFYLFTCPPRSKWTSSENMIFLRSKNALDGQLASTVAPIELCMASYQCLYAKFVSMVSPKSSIHTHFLPQQQYSRVYALFLAFHALVYRWGCQFISIFLQDNKHTDMTVLFFFQNP